MAPSCSPGATGTTRKTWTRQEKDNGAAHIQQLEAENKHLRELNQSIALEKHQAIRVCKDLAKQNAHLRSCLERLRADTGNRFPEIPEALQATYSSHTYHAPNSSLVSPVSITADSSPLVPSGGTDPQLQVDEPLLRSADSCQPSSRQPVGALGPQDENWSPVSMRSDALPGSSRVLKHAVDNTRQSASPRQSPHHGSQSPQPRPPHESQHSARPPIELSLQDDRVNYERRPSSSARSDVSMQSVERESEENNITADDGSGNESSDDSSSSGETDDDSDGKSVVDSFTSRDTSEEAIKAINSQTKFPQGLVSDVRPSNSITTPGHPSSRAPDLTEPIPQDRTTSTASSPATTRDVSSPARQLDPQTDVELEAAIRNNYARFGLCAQRLKFCYEPQPLDPTAINLGTNWKRRSNLNESIIEKLNQAGAEISALFPESDAAKATKREIDLIHRLCKCDPSKVACGSLKDVVGALRQEQNVTKDELNLIEFELYSTLIVMKRQSESEVSKTYSRKSGAQS